MKNKKILLAILIFVFGFMGVLSVLTMKIPIPPEAKEILESMFTKTQIKLLLLINPTIMLVVSVIMGTIFYKKVDFQIPIFEKIVGFQNVKYNIVEILKTGIILGVVAGVIISFLSLLITPLLPNEFNELSKSFEPSVISRFFYGGITEEILMRFGLMSFIVWLSSVIFNSKKPYIYWIGIVFSAILFGFGHFPVVFQSVKNPTFLLLIYILVGNGIGGILFGYAYWKKGLESAMIAHIFAHITMLSSQIFV